MDAWLVIVLVAGGFVGGFANAHAGGGSFVTFPLLMLAGLPPQVANATNRIAIILQCAAGSATYHRHGVLPWRQVPPLLAPSILGAVVGTLLASHLDEGLFRKVSAILLVLVAFSVFVDTKRWTRESAPDARIRPVFYPVVFLLGVYGGFLQIGIGTFLLGFFVFAGGYDVVRGNALKFGLVPFYQIVALAIFAAAGNVDWLVGVTLAAGNVLGGIVGAHTVVKKGAAWVRVVVVLSAVAAVLKLLFAD